MSNVCNLVSLEDLSSKFSVILFDTSALSGWLDCDNDFSNTQEKKAFIDKIYSFEILLGDYVTKGFNFYITSLISNEFSESNPYPYKKIIRRVGSYLDKEKLGSIRKRRDERKERSRLVSMFRDNGRILKLNEDEQNQYINFYGKYN